MLHIPLTPPQRPDTILLFYYISCILASVSRQFIPVQVQIHNSIYLCELCIAIKKHNINNLHSLCLYVLAETLYPDRFLTIGDPEQSDNTTLGGWDAAITNQTGCV